MKFVIVPACTTCNNSISKDEESFRNDLAMMADPRISRGMYHAFQRSMTKSPALRKELVSRLIPLGNNTGIKVPEARANRVLTKIARGLHFNHTKELIPVDYGVDVYLNPTEAILEVLELAEVQGELADGSLLYRGAIASDDHSTSIWWLVFHRHILAIVAFYAE